MPTHISHGAEFPKSRGRVMPVYTAGCTAVHAEGVTSALAMAVGVWQGWSIPTGHRADREKGVGVKHLGAFGGNPHLQMSAHE